MLGVFDSGFGGLTVLRAIHERLPRVSTLYLGDNARVPYGTRDQETIFKYTLQGIRWLVREKCPLVIIACNTASAQALRRIQREVIPIEFPDCRVLGVVRPLAEAAARSPGNGHFGVIGTKATAAAKAYSREIRHLLPDSRVTEVAAPNLAGLIEKGSEKSRETEQEIVSALRKLNRLDHQIETVLLACTHFQLVQETFEKHRPSCVRYLLQDKIVANALFEYLKRHDEIDSRLEKKSERIFLTTGPEERMSELGTKFFGSAQVFQKIVLN